MAQRVRAESLNSGQMVTCSECGASFAAANFCGHCGARYSPPDSVRQEAEQRYLTVLFCDLVGSTGLTEMMNAEEYHELLTTYQQAATRAMTEYGGHIAQYLGDGVLVYFGYPLAHEDDPRRAVLAAMAMVQGMQEINRESDFPPLAVRIGVHAGMVVAGKVGAGTSKDDLALGLAPNVAARLQSMAEPGTIIISDVLHGLVKGFFICDALGARDIKGVSEPMQLYRVTGVDTNSRYKASVMSGLTPFVGREEELARMRALWLETSEGRFTVAYISGEGGIGKSRLTRLVSDMSLEANATLSDAECSPLHSNTTLFPLIEMINALLLRMGAETAPEVQVAKLERLLTKRNIDTYPALPLIASLLNLPFENHFAMPSMGPELQREETLNALTELMTHARKPHLIVFEDLQWADATTLELVRRLIENRSLPSTMIVINARPEFVPPWLDSAVDYAVELQRLPSEELSALIRKLSDQYKLPESVTSQIMHTSDGVPLFAEELTKAVLDSIEQGQDEDSPEQMVPETLSASLMSRLDRLGSAKEIAQRASIFGRRFQYDQLKSIAGVSDSELQNGLDALIDAGMVNPVGMRTQYMFQFNHALVQVAAYKSMLRRARRQLHRLLVDRLESDFPEVVSASPELLARHCQDAQEYEKSIDYWFRAGQTAFARSANVEAAAHLRAGRELLDKVVDPNERAQRELGLLTVLGPALIATTGFASEEVGQVYDHARKLCDQLPANPETFPVLAGSWVYFLVKGDLETSRSYALEMLQLGEQTGDDHFLIEAHYSLGNSLYWLGDLEHAREHLEIANNLYVPERHQGHVLLFGQDPGVTARCYLTFTHWMLGHPAQAWAALDAAVAAAKPLDHSFTTAWPMAFRTLMHSHRREVPEALKAAEELITFALQERQVYWLQAAIIVRGWAQACSGDVETGIAGMRDGIRSYASTGAGVSLPHFHGLLAEALIADGHFNEAEAELSKAFQIATANGEAVAEISLWRLRGELAEMRGKHELALESCRRAVELSEELGAHGPGLRAAICLHQLLKGSQESPLARAIDRFGPDATSPDIDEARIISGNTTQ